MCDPMTIAGIALSAGSTIANYSAQSKIQSARNDAMAAERIRQNGLDQEAQALNTKSQDSYQDFGAKEEQKAANLAEYFTGQQVAEPSQEAALPTAANNLVIREEAKQRGKAKAFTDRTGSALGELRAFGDLLGDNSRLQARDATQIGQIGGFKRGSSNVLGYELDAANQAGGGMKMFGDILGGLGSVTMSSGLSGGSLFGLGGAGAGVPKVGTRIPVPTPRPTLGALYGGV
ncbi:Hypothetical protein NGAL_HAMBI2427_60080 [Neorhizobium galegae bv. orientalis]|nr:Hypothetical protein NGAL_HAMBI2427_60080 [Neorhizobium galegae bv. orientalis]